MVRALRGVMVLVTWGGAMRVRGELVVGVRGMRALERRGTHRARPRAVLRPATLPAPLGRQ